MQLMLPCSGATWWWMRMSGLLLPLGVVVRHMICGFYLFIFSSRLCCPLRFQHSPQTCQWEGFLVFGNFSSFITPSLGWVSIPNSFVSLFSFYILFYLLSKTTGCLSGYLVSSANVQKLFCGIFSAFNWSFDELGGGKWSSLLFLHHLRTTPLF